MDAQQGNRVTRLFVAHCALETVREACKGVANCEPLVEHLGTSLAIVDAVFAIEAGLTEGKEADRQALARLRAVAVERDIFADERRKARTPESSA